MGELRRPFFIAAIVLIVIVVLIESGSPLLASLGNLSSAATTQNARSLILEQLKNADLNADEKEAIVQHALQEKPPGVAIPAMSLLDGLLVLAVGLMGVALFVPQRVHGKYQGLVTLIVCLSVLVSAILWILLRLLPELLLMVGLLLAMPFGTLVYVIKWGFFNTPGASISLSVIMMFKFGFAVCLVLAHQRFLQNKGLVLLILTSLLANVIISFLHALVPTFLVSITDAIAAIVVCVLAAIWAVFLLIGALISIVKAVT